MSVIIKSEEVYNEYGDLVKLIYHYDNGAVNEKKVFISVQELEKMENVKKRWLGSKS
mgnify:CR=1 FL=1